MARACSGIKNPSSAFWAAAITIVAAAGFAEKAQAQWIDAATGKPVASGPMLAQKSYPGGGVRPGIEAGKLEGIPPNADDPNHAFDPVSGRNFFFDRRTCQWKDSATGQVVPSGP
ncbi:MAG TPA: hypothetical protein VHD34_08025, partial [Xanthobacteraceae bacterium]|nr:hypothetical protein [Xanthobacteraceae bacterium]